jgi:acyl dehydratase
MGAGVGGDGAVSSRVGASLRRGTWEEAEAMVGQVIGHVSGADPVTAADIRRKLEVIGLDAPIHTDAEAAKVAGYRTIVAPISMLRTWVFPAYWVPGRPLDESGQLYPPSALTNVPAPVDRVFATESSADYLAPVHPGDRISATAVLKSVTRKRTRVGDGAFVVIETTYRNQDDVIVAVESLTTFRFGEPVSLDVEDPA